MKQLLFGPFPALVMLVCCAVPSLVQSSLKPVEATSTPHIQSPTLSGEPHVLVLDISPGNQGEVTGSTVLRDVSFLTSAATPSIHRGKLAPASSHGMAEATVSRAAFAFLPFGILLGPSSLPKHSDGTPTESRTRDTFLLVYRPSPTLDIRCLRFLPSACR
jgi:hypothetical protein